MTKGLGMFFLLTLAVIALAGDTDTDDVQELMNRVEDLEARLDSSIESIEEAIQVLKESPDPDENGQSKQPAHEEESGEEKADEPEPEPEPEESASELVDGPQ